MRILLVEDSKTYASVLKRLIDKELFFATCDVVSSFEEMKSLEKEYDLYIVDYILKDTEGEQFEYLFKRQKKVIIITQLDKNSVNKEYLDKAVNFVIKSNNAIEYLIRFIKRIHKNTRFNVLITEDSALIRNLERKVLEKIMLNVFEAADGVEALEILKNEKIDIVITDMDMPNMDGEELIVNIRKNYGMSELPIILISGADEKEKFLEALKLGANDYLVKPFLEDELIIRINNIIEIYEKMNQIKSDIQKDSLTGALNRYFLENSLESMFELYEYKAIAMLDIDFFKKINDTYGHQTGDEILKFFAKSIKETIRKTDFLIRYGGEEFLIFMPNTTKQEAMLVLHKVKNSLKPYKNLKFTFSAGIADEGETLAEMIKLADERLYKAKKEGRNRIVSK